MKFFFAIIIIGLFVSSCSKRQDSAQQSTWKFIYKPSDKKGHFATVFGQPVQREELIRALDTEFHELVEIEKRIAEDKRNLRYLPYLEVKKRQYSYLIEKLKRFAERQALSVDAKNAKKSLGDFIAEDIVKTASEVTDDEFRDFLRSKHVSPEDLTVTAGDRLRFALAAEKRSDLISQYVAQKTSQRPIEVHIEAPQHLIDLKEEWMPLKGRESAALRVVLFSDFACTPCVDAFTALQEIQNRFPKQVAIGFRFFIPDKNPHSMQMAEAAMCIYEQGNEAFWRFHDRVQSAPPPLSESDIYDIGEKSGVPVDRIRSCLVSRRLSEVVDFHLEYGEFLGLRSLPTLFINGDLYVGPYNKKNITEALLSLLNEQTSHLKWYQRWFDFFFFWWNEI